MKMNFSGFMISSEIESIAFLQLSAGAQISRSYTTALFEILIE